MTAKVFVTRRIPDAGLELLRQANVELTVSGADRVLTKPELIEQARGCAGLLCLLTDRVDCEVIDAVMPRAIANYAVGVDNIDVGYANSLGIPVSNTPGVLTEATADMAWALLLAAARRVAEGDRFVRQGRFDGWSPTLLLGPGVHGKTLGILGMGRIGRAVARRARGFEMRVLYHQRTRADIEGASWASLDDLLSKSDFVSVHCPLTAATRGLLGPNELARMKTGAVLVNTARGEIVDQDALIAALQHGPVGAAGLDVYPDEAEKGIDAGWYGIDNVVLAPHLGSATVEARDAMARMAASDLLRALRGERPLNLVSPDRLLP